MSQVSFYLIFAIIIAIAYSVVFDGMIQQQAQDHLARRIEQVERTCAAGVRK